MNTGKHKRVTHNFGTRYHYNAKLIPSGETPVRQNTAENILHFSLTSFFFFFNFSIKSRKRTNKLWKFLPLS